ncbi:hypothetical protein NLK61_03340 [Pseudomonas fuscovaginae UPB0736]|nr:hypothetical protein [Pseudomonas fuscovaginae]UUQ65698.1 hypothetical protein NLK61_03340 [Pseudomonas fuscovaginae UPB0736]
MRPDLNGWWHAFDKPAPASLRIGQRMLVRFGVESQAVHVADQKSRVF